MVENIKTLLNIAKNGVLTHLGRFHADDILAAALLKISGVISDVSVIQRVGNVPKDFNGLVFDIGGGRFDHHQHDARVRPGGEKYAAFGLLWDAIGAEYIANKYETNMQIAVSAAEKFDTDFVIPMDLTDNFGSKRYPNTLSFLFSSRNDVIFSHEQYNEMFIAFANDLCAFLESAIYKSYKSVRDKIRAEELAVSDFITLPLDCDIDRSAFEGTCVKYIIKESHRGTYNITTVEPHKIPAEYVNMPGCVQVYSIGAAFDTYENALISARKLVEQ